MHEVKEHSVERLRSQWEETRRLLDQRVDLYQVHSLTVSSPLFEDLALQHALARIRDDGTPLGFTTSGAGQAETIERAWELEVGGRQLFSAVQSTWNALEPSVGRTLAEVHTGGWRVMLKETLANGRLAVDPPEVVRRVADEHAVTTDAVALAHALHQPWADIVLIGPVSVPQLESNLAAREVLFSEAEQVELAGLAADPARYWGERAQLTWH